jgi:hypothetical protein
MAPRLRLLRRKGSVAAELADSAVADEEARLTPGQQLRLRRMRMRMQMVRIRPMPAPLLDSEAAVDADRLMQWTAER